MGRPRRTFWGRALVRGCYPPPPMDGDAEAEAPLALDHQAEQNMNQQVEQNMNVTDNQIDVSFDHGGVGASLVPGAVTESDVLVAQLHRSLSLEETRAILSRLL